MKEYRNEDGLLHRIDGPAIIYPDGTTLWYQDGKCHREDGPAILWADGLEEWYQNGKRHREDGPAIIWADGDKLWYINGNKITDQVNQFFSTHKVKNYNELSTELKVLFKMIVIYK